MQSDEQLIEAILNGERAAYAELVRRYEASVCAVAVRILHNVHDGQDAAQETFIKAYENLPTLRKPDGRSFLWEVGEKFGGKRDFLYNNDIDVKH